MVGFIFGGDTELSYEELKRRQEVARALMQGGSGRQIRNVGEGIRAAADSLAGAIINKRANSKLEEGRSRSDDLWSQIFSPSGSSTPSGTTSSSNAQPSYESPWNMGSTGPAPERNTVTVGDETYDMGEPTEPEGWRAIQAGIFEGESGGDYDALFGFSNRPGKQFAGTKLTDMTVDEAIAFSDPSGPYAQWVKGQVGRVATPMGAYQVVGSTLRSVKNGLGLTGNERMTRELQDRIGQYILKTQGTGAWEGYRGPGDPGKYSQPVMSAKNEPTTNLGMIGGVKPDGGFWQSLDGNGQAHASNPNYRDYSQLFREYTFEEKPGYVPVGQRDGKTVYAAPDYMRDESGNYMPVSAAQAEALAKERGTLIPTRDEYRALAEVAQKIPMPTQNIGETGGTGDPAAYTAAVNQALNGAQPNAPIIHGKEFFAPMTAGRGDAAVVGQQGNDTFGQVPFANTLNWADPRNFQYRSAQDQQPAQPRQQQPQQPPQGTVTPRMAAIVEALGDPYIQQNPGRVAVLEALLADEMKRQQGPDPVKGTEVDGRLVNPYTGEVIYSGEQPDRTVIKGADGFNYYQDTGERVLPNVEQAPDMTNDEKLYERYKRDELEAGRKPLSFGEFLVMDEKAGNPSLVGPNGENYRQPVTPGQEKVDEEFAKSYIEWTQGGGPDAVSQLSKIEEVADMLAAGDVNLTGPGVGSIPNFAGPLLAPEATNARELVEEVVQRNLRLILGAQFTNEEGKRLIARAYNPRLPEEQNEQRLRRLASSMRAALEAKQDQVRYFEENGTLAGWSGKSWSTDDIIADMGIEDEGTTSEENPKGEVPDWMLNTNPMDWTEEQMQQAEKIWGLK